MKTSSIPNLKKVEIPRRSAPITTASEGKIKRLRNWMADSGYSAYIISHRDNFAWLTTGGSGTLIESGSGCVACLVVTADNKFVVGHRMDVHRLAEEQLPGQGYEIVSKKWYEGSPQQFAQDFLDGNAATDMPIPGSTCEVADIHHLHYPMAGIEIDRLRWLGAAVNDVYLKMADLIEPGMSEDALAIIFRHELDKQNIASAVSIAGSDERIFKHRHPMPTDKKIKKFIMLHTGARRWGLHAPISRFFHFGKPPQNVLDAYKAVAQIQAKTFSMTEPGIHFKTIFEAEKVEYEKTGYKDEWQEHYQGGPTGYRIVNANLGLSEAVIRTGMPFEWFSTVPGMKIAELTILTEDGLEMPSMQQDSWPKEQVKLSDGYACQFPGIYILK